MGGLVYLFIGLGIGAGLGGLGVYLQARRFRLYRQRTLAMLEDMNASAQRMAAMRKNSQLITAETTTVAFTRSQSQHNRLILSSADYIRTGVQAGFQWPTM